MIIKTVTLVQLVGGLARWGSTKRLFTIGIINTNTLLCGCYVVNNARRSPPTVKIVG